MCIRDRSYAYALSQIPDAELVGIYDNDRERGLSAAAVHQDVYKRQLRGHLISPEGDDY